MHHLWQDRRQDQVCTLNHNISHSSSRNIYNGKNGSGNDEESEEESGTYSGPSHPSIELSGVKIIVAIASLIIISFYRLN
jgi:hypothetical protein